MIVSFFNSSIQKEFLRKLALFLLAGVPGFGIALFLNVLFVEYFEMAKGLAYILVLVVQVSVNFIFCIRFVFTRDMESPLYKQFIAFFSGIAFFRLGDWGLYFLLVTHLSYNYIYIQLFNVFAFSIAKFLYSKRVIEGG